MSKIGLPHEPESKAGAIGPLYNVPEASASQKSIEVEETMQDDAVGLASEEERGAIFGPDYQYRRAVDHERPYLSGPSGPFDTSLISSTRSLHNHDLEYQEENNRRYVSNYDLPNDEDEQLRMQIIHQVHLSLFNNQLTSIPLLNPTEILDIGTGTGEWAIGMGETFPAAEITGTDLSAIQPSAVPPNVFFEVFDAEDEDDWTYPGDFFDLIHFRNMTGAFDSWHGIFERAFTHLRPGGWIEIVGFDEQISKVATLFDEDSEVQAWFSAMAETRRLSGKDVGQVLTQAARLRHVGFVDIRTIARDIPIGKWPTNPATRNTASLWLLACLAGVEATSLRPLTRDLGWDAGEVRRMCRIVEKVLKTGAMDEEKAKALCGSVNILVGRKPTDPNLEYIGMESALEVDEVQPVGKRARFSRFIHRREHLDSGSRDGSDNLRPTEDRTPERDVEMTL